VKPNQAVRSFVIILLTATLLLTGCGKPPSDSTEISEPETDRDTAGEIEWGREVNLDEMIALAQAGQIEEIQWHVLPNILRAQAPEGEIYHLRNENKGVDLRNKLLEAGVRLGKEGVLFRHVF
jgi:hypothetical protein